MSDVLTSDDYTEEATYPRLPTIAECKHFLAVINDGRRAIGLDELSTLDFDKCEPNLPLDCLSATHLFRPAGYMVYPSTVRPMGAHHSVQPAPAALTAIGSDASHKDIPESILAVTRPFDAETPGLRERLVEAGVVADG